MTQDDDDDDDGSLLECEPSPQRCLDSENKSSPNQVLGLMKMNRRLTRCLDSENKSSPNQELLYLKELRPKPGVVRP
ncbi:hypothetical protein P8452_32187 [Trifolium repens]|nr:hypothetical protein P8452_32187 [Trifolium repens]